MENHLCATCKYGHYEKGECICMTESDYIPHDVDPKNKCSDYILRNKKSDIQKIASELHQELLSDKELRNTFVASIERALHEMPPRIDIQCMAKRIADRIIGREEE